MDLQQLRALMFVAETGSITGAARQLAVTQPAVTRQIRALEEEFGGRLFDRTTKPVIPTALGNVALEHARRILRMSEDLRVLVSNGGAATRGRLRLGVVHSLARCVIPGIVRQVRQCHPSVQLRLSCSWSSALRREVEDGLLDAAIVLAPLEAHVPVGLQATRLSTETVTAISSATTALKGTVALDALRGSEWVVSREGCAYRGLLKRTLEQAEIPFNVAAEVHEIDLLLHLVSQGVGASILGSRLLPPHLHDMGLQAFRIQDVTLSLESRLIFRRTGPLITTVIPDIARLASLTLGNGRKFPWNYTSLARACQAPRRQTNTTARGLR